MLIETQEAFKNDNKRTNAENLLLHITKKYYNSFVST